jgi:outer membrane protein assembly factor BamB
VRRRIVVIGAAAATVLVGAGVAVAAYLAYLAPEEAPPTPHATLRAPDPPQIPAATPAPKPRPDSFEWRHYGYSLDHRRSFSPPASFRGPFLAVWKRKAPALLEFPPVMARDAIFQLADNGQLAAVRKANGKLRWKRKLGRLAASTPALGGGRVYATLLEGGRGRGRGRIVALRQRNGRHRWSRTLPSRSESSPLLAGGRVYFGSESGTVYCLDADNGHVIWTYRAAGAVKGSPTLAHGKLFFGDYGGHVQAVRASNGHRVWSVGGAGRIYATAAVAGGKVFLGSLSGRVSAYSTRNGHLKWSHGTGSYVYASAAVTRVRGAGPTVFVGSYDGRFYALRARSGRTLWTHNAGGRISGSATVIGRVVYFADLGHRRTLGLGTRTGRVAFHRHQGAYDPVVSDGRRLYLTGNHSLTALRPLARHGAAAHRRAARRARKAAHRRARSHRR